MFLYHAGRYGCRTPLRMVPAQIQAYTNHAVSSQGMQQYPQAAITNTPTDMYTYTEQHSNNRHNMYTATRNLTISSTVQAPRPSLSDDAPSSDGGCAGGGTAAVTTPAVPRTAQVAVDTLSVSQTAKHWLSCYGSLSKWRLGSLVLATTVWGYAMAPAALAAGPLLACTVGTALTIASANTFNQLIEVNNDSQMKRTQRRWLPTGKISQAHAATFGAACGLGGVGLLLAQVNPLAACLAGANIGLYALVYTPMKQKHPFNTYVGAVVGAIPPLIGWAACAGSLDASSMVLASLLTVWQLPHFMALSWSLREDYARGGFKMLVNVRPERVPSVVLNTSLLMCTIGPLASMVSLTDPYFALDSLIPSGVLTWTAFQFYRNPTRDTARRVFRYTLWVLPVLMCMMLAHRKRPDTQAAQKLEPTVVTSS